MAAMAAVGSGGVAMAQGKSALAAPLTVSDLPGAPGAPAAASASGPASAAVTDPAESLRTRILAQAHQPQGPAPEPAAAPAGTRPAARTQAAAARTAAFEAPAAAETEDAAEAAARAVREEAAGKKAEEAAEQQAANAEQRVGRAADHVRPVASYTLAAGFGELGSPWATSYTGQDFASPTGTPVVAVHGGSIASAGWAGPYGYRIVLKLADGAELWYCHLSSIVRAGGAVTTGEVIGRVGATGKAAVPHLHLQVRPAGGQPIDPLVWLREQGVAV